MSVTTRHYGKLLTSPESLATPIGQATASSMGR